MLTSEHALRLDRVPASVVVLGGGVIGCEFASVWARFGAEVTIVEALPRLVAAEDEASSKALERAFRKRKIALPHRHAVPERQDHRRRRRGHRRGRRRDRGRAAAGRGRPRARRPTGSATTSRASRWSAASCSPTSAAAPTSRASTPSATSCPGLQLAHRGFQQGIFVAEEIAGLDAAADRRGRHPAGHLLRPRGRLGRARPRRRRARAYGDDAVETLTYDLGGNGKSQILKTQGFVKLVRRTDGPVVGVHMVGARVGELDRRGPADLQLGGATPRTSPRSCTPTRPRTRRSARRTSRSPASRCTPTPDRPRHLTTETATTGSDTHMATEVNLPAARRVRHRRHRHPLAQAGRRRGRGRRAAARGLHRQGRHRDPLAGRRARCWRSRPRRTRPSRSAPSSA